MPALRCGTQNQCRGFSVYFRTRAFVAQFGRFGALAVCCGSKPRNPTGHQAVFLGYGGCFGYRQSFGGVFGEEKWRGVTEPDAVEKSLARYQAFQADDIKILDDSRALFDWCCRQTYIALANMMTGAAMTGIDSCPVEGFNYADMERVLSGQFGLFDAAEWGVSVAATFGYRVQEIATKARRPLEETVIWA